MQLNKGEIMVLGIAIGIILGILMGIAYLIGKILDELEERQDVLAGRINDIYKKVIKRDEQYQLMYDKAKEYYELLEKADGADQAEKERIKEELDILSAPFSEYPAYHAFLEMERLRKGLR